MNFNTKNISPLELILDKNNPRFIVPPNSDENDIIKYLLEYEQILELIQGINANEGLLVGERIIVFKENGKYIVAEGNRRTCACKLILNNNLIPKEYKNSFPKISKQTIDNISKIPVDIVSNKNEALNAMGTKHISGIKKWSPYSKMQFFALQFDNNKSIDYLCSLTSVSNNSISNHIKQFKLINYTKSLDIWSPEERNNLFNFYVDKVTIFPRALTSISKRLGTSIAVLLKIDYDEKTLYPSSQAPQKLFNYCIYKVAKYSYDEDIKFNTRSKIDEITDLIDILEKYKNNEEFLDLIPLIRSNSIASSNEPINQGDYDNNVNQDNNSGLTVDKGNNTINTPINSDNIPPTTPVSTPLNKDNSSDSVPLDSPNTKDITPINIKRPKPQKPKKRPTSKKFFSTLTWSTVNPNNAENIGLIDLCTEIVKISKTDDYKKYPISATILARALFEQTLVYHLKKIGKYNKFVSGYQGKVPPLEKTILYYKKDLNNIFDNKDIQRCFSVFTDSQGNKHYFDMVIHNPQLIKANPNNLDQLAEFGLRGFIHSVLNL